MAANSTFAGFHAVFLLYLLVCGPCGSLVNADEGTDYLDRKESYVRSIADSARQNQENCGNLEGCRNACTQAVCHPLSGAKTAQCTLVDNNEFCQVGDGLTNPCKSMLLDYTRSFVTLPPPGDITRLQTEVARDICLQIGLVPTFLKTSNSSEFSYVYFGSASGAWRAYPGRESDCAYPYDARKRPWYLNGISVKKEVKILIDVGSTMATQVGPEYNRPNLYTYLNVAQDIVLELLQTFSPEDIVEVISFDSRNASSLGAPVNVKPYDSFNYTTRPELLPLVKSVQSLDATSGEVAPSNLDAAVVKAVNSFQPPTTLTSEFLKVIIVLSNGLFAPLNSTGVVFPSTELLDLRAKLMIYKLPPNPDKLDPFLEKTSLKANLCSVSGSFELLDPQTTTNPLYATRSYFTYLARVLLIAVGNKTNWSNKYQSQSQLHNITTVTYPVFGSDGLLTGVAGIDVAIEDLLPLTLRSLVLSDFPNRSKGTISAPANFPMTCHYQNTTQVMVCSNSTASWSIDDAVCKQTDFTSSIQQRTCCTGSGTCAVVSGDPGGSGSSKKKIGIIVGSVVGGVAVLAILALILILRRRPKATPRIEMTDVPFSGDAADRAPAEADDFRFRRDEQALGPGFR